MDMNRTTNKLNSLCCKCVICDRGYKFNKTLRAHLNRRLGKKCPKCETNFRLYGELKGHLEEKHGSDGHVKRLDLNNIGENVPAYPMTPAVEMISHIEEIVSESDNAPDTTKIVYNKKLLYSKCPEQIKMKTDTLLELINYVDLDKHKTASICNYLDMAIGELENWKTQHKQDKTPFFKVSSKKEQTDPVVPLRESEGPPVKVLSINNSVLNSCNVQNTKVSFYDHDYC